MKKLLVAILVVMFMAGTAMAKDVTIQVGWDANIESDMAQYVVYHRVEGQGYNYTVPIKIVPFPGVETDILLPGVPDNAVTKNYLVIRAEDTNQNQSGDSNEIWASFESDIAFTEWREEIKRLTDIELMRIRIKNFLD